MVKDSLESRSGCKLCMICFVLTVDLIRIVCRIVNLQVCVGIGDTINSRLHLHNLDGRFLWLTRANWNHDIQSTQPCCDTNGLLINFWNISTSCAANSKNHLVTHMCA